MPQSISTSGIVWATCSQEMIIANHRMPTISFALGGDFEDYEVVAYVAKSRGGFREVFPFSFFVKKKKKFTKKNRKLRTESMKKNDV